MAGKKPARVHLTVVERDLGWKKIKAEVALAKDSYAKVGLLGGDKDRRAGDPLGNVEIGIVHEFGSEKANIPPRPWLRGGIDFQAREIQALFEKFSKAIYEGKMTVDRALGLIGAKAAAGVRAYVTGPGVPPPNAPSTLARKEAKGTRRGKVKALVDTGRMIASVAYETVIGGRGKG